MSNGHVRRRGSESSRVLERAWAALRRAIPELPAAVVLPTDAGGRLRKWGSFAPSSWRVRGPRNAHEVSISPGLFSDPERLLATMVHEAVHALLFATVDSPRHLAGVSRSDRYYHRREFRDACVKLGLECAWLNGRYGWTLTSWPVESGVPVQYKSALAILRELPPGAATGVPWHRVPGRPLPASGMVRLTCGCAVPRVVLVPRAQADKGPIVCGVCNEGFQGACSAPS